MAVTITATVGHASANSFVTLAEWSTYMEGRLNPDVFDAASTDTKNRALVEATRELTVLDWVGYRTTTTQALAWPREWAVDPDSESLEGSSEDAYYEDDEIPQRVKNAEFELALAFLKAGTTDLASLDGSTNIKRERIDVIEVEYVDGFARASGLARFPAVMREIGPLLCGYGAANKVERAS